MQVKFNCNYTVAVDGINIVTFKIGEVVGTLPDDKAALYIERGVCELHTAEGERQAPAVETENKMVEPVTEKAVQPLKLKKGK